MRIANRGQGFRQADHDEDRDTDALRDRGTDPSRNLSTVASLLRIHLAERTNPFGLPPLVN